jgi:hypothetical protein
MMDWGFGIDVAWKVGALLAGLGSILFAAAKWGSRKSFITREEFAEWLDRHDIEHDSIKTRLSRGDVRFTEVEATLRHLPTKDDLGKLSEAVATMTAEVRGIGANVHGLERSLRGLAEQVTMLVENEIKGAAR